MNFKFTRHYITLAIATLFFWGIHSDVNAQCQNKFSFNNEGDIPTQCDQSWNEGDVSLSVSSATNGTCATGNCAFTVTDNGNQYNFLNISSGSLEIGFDFTGLDQLSFQNQNLPGTTGCARFKLLNGSNIVYEQEVNQGYYTTEANLFTGLTFDKIVVEVSNRRVYNFETNSFCNDGAPAFSPVIDFEEFQQGMFIGNPSNSGLPWFSSQGVDVYYVDENGNVVEPPQFAFIWSPTETLFGHGFNNFFTNGNLLFDFTNLANPVNLVYFDNQFSSTNQSIAVNGGAVWTGIFSEAPVDLFPGYTFADFGQLGATQGQRYSLAGNIETLLIGAEEFFVDNVSFAFGSSPVCSITNFAVLDSECNADQNGINASIYFDVEDPGGNQFEVSVDGIPVEVIPLNTGNVYNLENLPIGDNTQSEITICMTGTNCCATTILYTPDCANQSCITFEDTGEGTFYSSASGAEPGDLLPLSNAQGVVASLENYVGSDGSTSFQSLTFSTSSNFIQPESMNLALDFSAVDGEVHAVSFQEIFGCCFSIEINDIYYYYDDLSDFMIDPPNGITVSINTVGDPGSVLQNIHVASTDPLTSFSIGTINGQVQNFCYYIEEPECELTNLTFDIGLCNAQGIFPVVVDFDYTGNTDSFNILAQSVNSDFSYADLPITLSMNALFPFSDVLIQDLLGGCTASGFIESPDCEAETCNMTVELVWGDCEPDSLFYVTVLVDHVGPGVAYTITANGEYFGEYAYTDPPPVVGPFPANTGSSPINIMEIADTEFGSQCSVGYGFYGPTCTCEVYELELVEFVCSGDGLVDLEFSLSVINAESEFFEAFINNTSLGLFPINASNSYSMQGIPVYNNIPNTFSVCVNEDIFCCEDFSFTPLCGPSGCTLSNLDMEFYGCIDGTLWYSYFFSYISSQNEEYFEASLNGNSLGEFLYTGNNTLYNGQDSEFYIPNAINEMQICFTDIPDCCETVSFFFECEPNPVCQLSNAIIEQLPCNADGTFNVLLDFDYVEQSAIGFSVVGNGQNYGNFQYESLPVEIGPFESGLDVVWELIITDADVLDCTLVTEFTGQDCTPPACAITGLEILGYECVNESLTWTYNFQASNSNSDFFELWLNGNSLGEIPYNGNIYDAIDTQFYIPNSDNELQVCMVGQPDCCQTISFFVECAPTECDLNLELTNVFCFPEDTVLSFAMEIMDAPIFTTLNGVTTGPIFINSSNTFSISGQTINSGEANTITVCVNEINCCQDFIIFPSCAPQNCNMDAVVVEPQPCTPNGIFYVEYDLTHTGAGNSFTLTGNGENYGTYQYSDLPIEVGPFVGDPGATYELIATDVDNTNCSAFVDFDAQDCGVGTCSLTNLEITGAECFNGELVVAFAFEVNNPANDLYEAWWNDEYLGSHPINFNNGQYLLENISSVIPDQVNTFLVCINDNPDCCQTVTYVPQCFNPPTCEITNPTIEFLPCNDLGEFFVSLDFDFTNVNSGAFDVVGNGQNYGEFSYADLPVTIGPFESGLDLIWELVMSDQQFQDCANEVVFQGQECPTLDCSVNALAVEIFNCVAGQPTNIDLFANVISPLNDFVDIWVNQEFYGNLPVSSDNYYQILDASVNSGQDNTITICANDNPDCCDTLTFIPNCIDPIDCQIIEPFVELTECNTQGEFFAVLNFEYTTTNSGAFNVFGNGLTYGEFSYTDLPITVGPFQSGADLVWELIIQDQQFADCANEVVFQGQNCSTTNCAISNTFIEVLECSGENLVDIEFGFSADNPGNDFWEATLNNEYLGLFEINPNNYYSLQNLPINSNQENTLTICINDQPDCCASITFVPDCPPTPDCVISNPTVELMECNTQGEFFAVLNFEYTTTNSGAFNVFGNGQTYGEFSYTDLPITVGPFESGADIVWELIIEDQQFENCGNEVGFQGQDCPIGDCAITDLFLEVLECSGDNLVDIEFGFTPINPGNDFWEATLNDENIGLFEFNANNYYSLQNLQINSNQENTLTICVNDQPDCCHMLTFVPECTPTPDCVISNPTVELTECNTQGEFFAVLNFEYTTTNSGAFNVFGNGQTYGEFSYTDLPITIGPFESGADLIWELIIEDQQFENCVNEVGFQGQDCPIGDCAITNLTLEVLECTSDNSVDIEFAFIPVNPGNTFWEATLNGEYVGFYEFNLNNYYSLQNLQINSDQENTLTICVNDQPDCCQVLTFIPECNPSGECEISELDLTSQACLDNGLVNLNFGFEVNNTQNDFWLATLNGEFVGEGFLSTQNEYELFGQVINLGGENTLTICIGNNNDCCSSVTFIGETCLVNECLAPVHPDGFGSYGSSTGEEPGFVVPNYGNYATITLQEYPGAPGLPAMFGDLEIPDFSIWSAVVHQIGIEMDVSDVPGNVNEVSIISYGGCCFNLGINGTTIYAETIADLPTTLPNGYEIIVTPYNGPGSNDGFSITLIGDNIETFFFAGTDAPIGQICYLSEPSSNDCEIGELQTELVDCDEEQYYVILDFDYANTSEYFQLGGTLPDIDPILYSELPITLGPFNANEAAYIEVIDDQNNQCFSEIEIAPNPCGPACNISDLNLELLECLNEGTYAIFVNFEHDFSENEIFQIYLNGQITGSYSYGDLPLDILNLEADAEFIATIEIVTALDNCTLVEDLYIANCEGDDCLNFNNLEAGLTYQTGNGPNLPIVLFEQEGATVSLNDCGPTDFYYFEVINSPICEVVPQGSNGILLGGASLDYDFTNWNALPTSLSFAFCGETSFYIDAVDQSFSLINGGPLGPIDMGNGYSYSLSETSPGTYPITITIQGPGIGELSICASDGYYGPVCYQFGIPPNPTDGCYGFENLADGDFYTSNTAPTNFYSSNALTVSPSDEISEFDFLGITSDNTNPQFNGANNNLGVLMGTVLFDFSETDQPTEFVNFDFAGSNLEVKVNEGSIISFSGLGTTDSLILADNGVVLFFHREASNPIEGTVSLFGAVNQLWIAGEEVSLDNICYYFEIQQAEIWPGDINSNNTANHFDLLYLGIASGAEGPARNNPLSTWQGQTGQDWEQFFISNGINYKHADANGDGRVDEEDYLVLKDNIGNLHGPVTEVESLEGTPEDPPIYVDLNANGPLTAGEAFSVPINLGTLDNPVFGLHGVAFSIQFDPEQIDPNTVDIVLDENSWLGEDLWILTRVLPEGIIEVAISRKDQESKNGFGGIAYFIGIIDDLVGKEVDNDLIGVRAISGDESDVLLYAQGSSGTVTTSTDQNELLAGLHVFPNPADDIIHVRNYNVQDLKRITIHNVLGQQVYLNANPIRRNALDISGLESGVFFIQLYFASENYTYKVEVIH